MACRHTSTKRQITGQQDTCIQDSCKLPIIFDGRKWVWVYQLSPSKLRSLDTAFRIAKRMEARS